MRIFYLIIDIILSISGVKDYESRSDCPELDNFDWKLKKDSNAI